MKSTGVIVGMLVLGSACVVQPGDDGLGDGTASTQNATSGNPPATDDSADSTDSADATTTTTGDMAETADDEVKFDMLVPDFELPPAEDGCQKIDFLFVVDNSGSMQGYQDELAASFPDFIDTVQTTLDVEDFRIMVVDTDGPPLDCLEGCGPDPLPNSSCNGANCLGLPEPGTCEATLGAGRTTNREGLSCSFDSGTNYMDADQSDLANTFACAASIGGGQGLEVQMEAMVQAVSPELNAPGGCNDGFLRDDAILVVTVLSDENDGSGGGPPDWFADVVAAKGGNEQAVVMLTVVGDGDVEGGVCGFPSAPEMREFAELFTFGSWGSVCEPSYGTFFTDAVSVIDTSCDLFEPAG